MADPQPPGDSSDLSVDSGDLSDVGKMLASTLLPKRPPPSVEAPPPPVVTAPPPAATVRPPIEITPLPAHPLVQPVVASPEPEAALATPALPAVAATSQIPASLSDLPFSEGDDDDDGPSGRRILIEWVAVLASAVLIAVVIITFGIQAFKIPSESMQSTLQIDDRVLVNKLSYRFHDLNRGDVVVFRRPEGSRKNNDSDPDDLIKRVIGLPGERIAARNGRVYVNERLLNEPYVADGVITDHLDDAVTVPAGHVFVMGDNRSESYDSRFFGPIDGELVIGRAFAILWPPSRIGSL